MPGATDAQNLYARSPAAPFDVGAEGIPLPPSRSTAHFSDSQVMAALTTVKDYIVRSSLHPEVLTGREVRPARSLIDSGPAPSVRPELRPPGGGRPAHAHGLGGPHRPRP